MSSSAKRLVLSLRERGAGGGSGGGGRERSGRGDSGDGTGGGNGSGGGSGSGSGAATTSATRLCHYDSGHELDEISIVGVGTRNGESVTPTTPCHCKYGSGQTLYSVATSVPPAPAAPTPRVVPGKLKIGKGMDIVKINDDVNECLCCSASRNCNESFSWQQWDIGKCEIGCGRRWWMEYEEILNSTAVYQTDNFTKSSWIFSPGKLGQGCYSNYWEAPQRFPEQTLTYLHQPTYVHKYPSYRVHELLPNINYRIHTITFFFLFASPNFLILWNSLSLFPFFSLSECYFFVSLLRDPII